MRQTLAAALALLAAIPLFTPAIGATSAPTQVDGVLTSFDGTPIVYTLFMPADASAIHRVPVVIQSHGWAGTRQTTPDGFVGRLLAADFGVLTFDERGFGASGNVTELMSPDYEIKDLSGLIDKLASDPRVALDAPGDPRIGMEGLSYGGGIQTLGAEFDHRIDVIEPEITWNDLRYSLVPNGVPKLGWVNILFGAGAATTEAQGLDPRNPAGPQSAGYGTELPTWYTESIAADGLPADVDAALWHRSPGHYAASAIPTLILQGAPDTLFDMNEGVANYAKALATGAPTKLVIYCGGHAGCPYDSASRFSIGGVADASHVDALKLAWMERYLHGDASVDTGPNVEWYRNDGVWRSAASWPPPLGSQGPHFGGGDVTLVPAPLLAHGNTAVVGPSNAARVDGVTSARIPIYTATFNEDLTGIPHLDLAVSAPTGIADASGFLFFRLVDATDGTLLDGQSQPLAVHATRHAPGLYHTDLVGTSYLLPAGHQLAVEVTTSDAAFMAAEGATPLFISFVVSIPTAA